MPSVPLSEQRKVSESLKSKAHKLEQRIAAAGSNGPISVVATKGSQEKLRRSIQQLYELNAEVERLSNAPRPKTTRLALPNIHVDKGSSVEQLWGQLNVLYAPVLRHMESLIDKTEKRSRKKRSKKSRQAPGEGENDTGAMDEEEEEGAEGDELGAEEDMDGDDLDAFPPKKNKAKKAEKADAWRYAFGSGNDGDEDDDPEEGEEEDEEAALAEANERELEGDEEMEDYPEGDDADGGMGFEEGEELGSDEDNAAAMAELYGEGDYDEELGDFGGDGDDLVDDEDEGNYAERDGYGEGFDEGDRPVRSKSSKVKFGITSEVDGDGEGEGADDAVVEAEEEEDLTGLSTFEKAERKRLREITELEESRLFNKDWTMGGEVAAAVRPRDALLDEKLEFEHAMRPVPVITAQLTQKLEDRIKKRIVDSNFDDVERKKLRTTASDLNVTKKDEELDAQKSKLSLMDLYEKEYLEKQKKASADEGQQAVPLTEIEKDELRAITMWKRLAQHLDALSNFFFTPKPVQEEVETRVRAVESQVPAIALEAVGVLGVTSTEAALAPQDLFRQKKSKFVGVSKEEMNPNEKKALRRQHKTSSRDKKELLELVKAARAKKSGKQPKSTAGAVKASE